MWERLKASLGCRLENLKIELRLLLDEDRRVLKAVRPYTLLSLSKLQSLKRLAALMNESGVSGDFVECGAWRGGSAAFLAAQMGPQRHLWIYDSFQGLPPVSGADGTEEKGLVGTCVASPEEVVKVLSSVGISGDRYTIRPGWFKDSFRERLPGRVALLHADCDWYDSVTLTLETIYPLIPEGGCVILDDFGCWEGCRKAFYDFCLKHGERPLLERVGSDQAYWIKGKQHNRC